MKTSRKNSKQRSRQLKKHAKRLAAYSAAAAATVLTTGDRSANAAEVVWNIPDVTVRNAGAGSDRGIVFDMVTGGTELNRPLGGPDPNNTLPNGPGYWPSRGKFRLTASWGGYLYHPSYKPDPNGTVPSLYDPNGSIAGHIYQRPPLTYDPTASGKAQDIGIPVHSTLGSSRWNIGLAGSMDFNGLPYYVGVPIGVAGQNFVFDGPYRGQSWYGEVKFPLGTTAVVGIHFKLSTADPNDSPFNKVSHFGWAEVSKFRIGGGDFEFILHGWGYQTTPAAQTVSVSTTDNLSLEVHADGAPFPGKIFIKNDSFGDVAFDYYRIQSPSGGGNATLDPGGWDSLEDQDYEGSDIADLVADGKGDGLDFLEWQRSNKDEDLLAAIVDQYGLVPPNSGWEELGVPSDVVVSEGRLQGTTILKVGESIDLGLLYDSDRDTFPGTGFFRYVIPGGLIRVGSIVVINTGAIAASAAVPEPNSIMLLAAGATGLGIWRRRKQV